jgi:hypothetical protein
MKCPDCREKIPSGIKICCNCGGDVSTMYSMRLERNMLFAVLAASSTFIGTLLFAASR